MKNRHKGRELALQTLYAMDFNNQLATRFVEPTFSATTIDEYNELENDVKIYGMYLVRGTLENLGEIDELISRFSLNRPIEKIDYVDRNILRISVFCFKYEDIHPHIVIDEAVKLSQDFSTEVNYKFINGILDAMQKQLFPLKEEHL